MIQSAIEDNWMRVDIMHSIAQGYYLETHDSDFRERSINNGPVFPFNSLKYEAMKKESCMVGMTMAWSVICIESLINHALAENIDDRDVAIKAIEYPGTVVKKFTIPKSIRSELSKKIIILANNEKQSHKFALIADELSDTRNLIVHDKPFELRDYGNNGDVEVTHLRKRGDPLENKLRYGDLTEFYRKCEDVKGYIGSISSVEIEGIHSISFAKLVGG